MKKQNRFHLPLLAALALAAAPAAHAQLAAGNLRAAQRTGTKLVDIDYDLTGTTNPVTVLLEISADGGTTWSVPATTLTGAVGPDVTPGSNLRITWNAEVDWNNQTSAQMQFRLRVSGPLPDLEAFAHIPAGGFTMGDTLDGMTNATPSHWVTVSGFYMQKTEVTKAEWDSVRNWGLSHGYSDIAIGDGTAGDHPVRTVSWYDVVKWCNAKSEKNYLTPCYYTDAAQTAVFKTGTNAIDHTMVNWSASGYRLPTEAEWEKAARGGLIGKRYPLGDTLTQADANFSSSGTVAVGTYAPNGYGLFDMAGNVFEWSWDWYDGAGYGGASAADDPKGPESGVGRARRGGGWTFDASLCRVADRYYNSGAPPAGPHDNIGFRPVCRDVSFALIPGGAFTMGDTLDGMAEAPPHPVNVSTFYMQKTGVTKAEWDAVRDWGLTHGYTDLAEGAGKAADHPVHLVTWYDVVKWCNARSEKESLTPCYYADVDKIVVYRTGNADIDNTMVKWQASGYRLPTEAEREKAARGGLNGKRFPWGDTITHSQANYFSDASFNNDVSPTRGHHPTFAMGGLPYTSPVGIFAPNAYGIYDMAGNVWEWSWDWYGSAFYESSPSTDPLGASPGAYRVLRGGNWNEGVSCRTALRGAIYPVYMSITCGFRPVRANLVIADSPNVAVITTDPILTLIAPHGTTDPVAGQHQYPLGTIVELTGLTPDLGYVFSKWTIGIGGGATHSTANPLSVTMDADKTVTAVFATDSRDPDDDGLTNYEELVSYGTNPNIADTDGDSFKDGYEVHHGTSPTDPGSRPDATLQIFTAVEVRLDTALGQSYRMESSTDLQTWTTVEEHIPGTGGIVTRFYSIQEIPKRYFRPVRE